MVTRHQLETDIKQTRAMETIAEHLGKAADALIDLTAQLEEVSNMIDGFLAAWSLMEGLKQGITERLLEERNDSAHSETQ